MFTRILSLLFILLPPTLAGASETCPRPDEIVKGQYRGFKAYANENGSPIVGDRLKQFENNVAAFYSTRWLAGAFEGEAHCYYMNKYHRWTYAFLSKPGLVPDKSSKAWYLDYNEPRCNESLSSCRFVKAIS